MSLHPASEGRIVDTSARTPPNVDTPVGPRCSHAVGTFSPTSSDTRADQTIDGEPGPGDACPRAQGATGEKLFAPAGRESRREVCPRGHGIKNSDATATTTTAAAAAFANATAWRCATQRNATATALHSLHLLAAGCGMMGS